MAEEIKINLLELFHPKARRAFLRHCHHYGTAEKERLGIFTRRSSKQLRKAKAWLNKTVKLERKYGRQPPASAPIPNP